ncbi:MAG: hypothetical protein Q7S86_04225 [bacterium]|nr:hypothetical protein [bacterium]
MTKTKTRNGSKGAAQGVPKNPPQQPQLKTTTVRRIEGSTPWFEPDADLLGAARKFNAGIIIDPTFNPTATVMEDVFCGTRRVSEAEVTGLLVPFGVNPLMPSDVVTVCQLNYNPRTKTFHEKGRRHKTIVKADYLLLSDDGTSIVGWKE